MVTRLDSPTKFKVTRTDDGRMHCEGAFAKDGILEYRNPNGQVIRELRRPEVNADPITLESFKFLPMTIEHPPLGLLNSQSYKSHAIGMTDSSARYDSEFGGIVGLLSIFDGEAIRLVDSKQKVELSAGYTCDILNKPGIWHGQPYDREQINVRANHLALTSKGRAGQEVCLRMDSADIEAGIGIALDDPHEINKFNFKGEKRMAAVRCDGVEYENIPEVFASVMGQKLTQLEQLKQRLDTLDNQHSTLLQQLEDLESERDQYQGRCDGYEIIVDNADTLLEQLGYERNLEGEYIYNNSTRTDSYEDDEEDDEDYYDDDEEEDDEYYDDEDDDEYYDEDDEEMRRDSHYEILNAWKEADEVIEGFSDAHYDSAFDISDIQRIACAEIAPELDLSDCSDSYVSGIYDYFMSESDEDDYDDEYEYGRYDSADYAYNSSVDTALRYGYNSRFDMCGGSDDEGLTEKEKERKQAYKSGLTVSKKMA